MKNVPLILRTLATLAFLIGAFLAFAEAPRMLTAGTILTGTCLTVLAVAAEQWKPS